MRLLPDLVYTGGRVQSGLAVETADGRIAHVTPAGHSSAGVRLPGKLLLPGTVNAHCHTFQSLLRGLGDDLDFMAWRDRVLYPYSTRLDRDGIHLGAAFAFAEMLLHGATTCVDFFYLQDEGNDNAEAVIRAAPDGGMPAPGASSRARVAPGRVRPLAPARSGTRPPRVPPISWPDTRRTPPCPCSRRLTAPTAPRPP